MLAEKPYLLGREKPLSKKEIAQALRWAIEAELDAISFYEQLAELIEDERIKHIFYDVANEEKEHVGEFLAALLEVDPELLRYMREGFDEVEEETGIKVEL
ncbi:MULTISPECIES: ferritin family protein [Thermococcus]|uniref:Rubrerythrin family protein n=1 Tax=Thermococcus radiotolerans TaxID=187880 RepID=A0A2Z2N0C4_9EURY|nr:MULTISPECIES: ferritin family protein [Thermococcus]ASA77672.1 rubrerythrin family protein [Thermococcus sp. 5-4]ASJ13890.1 rubrerythrin family protein [Thermococcus radiotolerans]